MTQCGHNPRDGLGELCRDCGKRIPRPGPVHVVLLEEEHGRLDIVEDVLVSSVDGVRLTRETAIELANKLIAWAQSR